MGGGHAGLLHPILWAKLAPKMAFSGLLAPRHLWLCLPSPPGGVSHALNCSLLGGSIVRSKKKEKRKTPSRGSSSPPVAGAPSPGLQHFTVQGGDGSCSEGPAAALYYCTQFSVVLRFFGILLTANSNASEEEFWAPLGDPLVVGGPRLCCTMHRYAFFGWTCQFQVFFKKMGFHEDGV